MIAQGWPLWAVSDEEGGRDIYAIVGWENDQPVGILISGEFLRGQAGETLLCPLAFFGELGDARQAARRVAGA